MQPIEDKADVSVTTAAADTSEELHTTLTSYISNDHLLLFTDRNDIEYVGERQPRRSGIAPLSICPSRESRVRTAETRGHISQIQRDARRGGNADAHHKEARFFKIDTSNLVYAPKITAAVSGNDITVTPIVGAAKNHNLTIDRVGISTDTSRTSATNNTISLVYGAYEIQNSSLTTWSN